MVNGPAGFTLLELMLVIAVLVILAAIGTSFYNNYANTTGLESNAGIIKEDLRGARDRAMNGAADRNWGAHLVNGNDDYYEIFSSPSDYADASKTVIDTVYLRNKVSFSAPAEGNSLDVVFTKISGTTTAASVIVASLGQTKTVSVSASGKVN